MVTECVGTIKAALLPIYDEWHDEIQRIGSSFFVRFKAPTGNPEIDIQYFFQQLEISFGYLRTVRKQGDATTVCA
jgi:hypothetical protein